MDEDIKASRILRIALILIIFVGVVFCVRRIVLGNTQLVKLSNAPALSGQISQALGPGTTNDLQQINKDYTITTKKFIEDGWLVVYVKPTNREGATQNAYVTMREDQGIFQAVTGPGTAISSTQLLALPPDVAAYLEAYIAVDNPPIGN